MDPTAFVTPCLLAGAALYALRQRVDVFSALTQGAGEGLSVVIRILPALAALLTAVYMLRASGAMDALAAVLSPVLGALGIPPETAALLLVRPVSGSGALAVGSQLMEQYGPDSAVGRTAAVMRGCSETTFYTVAVNFSDKAAVEKNKEFLMLNLNEVMVLPFEPDPFAVKRYEDMLDMEFSVIVP